MYGHGTFGTKVKNPVHRMGRSPYTKCCHCEKLFTHLGIARHWDKCPKNPKRMAIQKSP